MLLANTHFDIVVGIDIHIVMVPTPAGPVPTPLPHPYVGYVFDIGDLIPFIGAKTFINYKIRGCSFTGGKLGMLSHLPTPPGVSFSPKPIGHDSFNFFGSLRVKMEGNMMAVSPFMVMTCNCIGIPLTLSVPPGKSYKPVPTTYLPTSMSVPIPLGKPVLVGGPYVPDIMGMIMSLVMSYGFSAILKLFGRALNALLKKMNLECTQGLSSRLCRMFGEPVDLATGRVVYTITDFEIPGPLPIKWERNWYSDSGYDGILGHGTHLCYDMTLITDYDESVTGLILPDGRATAFALLLNPGEKFYNRPEKMTLLKEEDHYKVIDHRNHLVYRFEQVKKNTYKPITITNLNGFSVRFTYNLAGKISTITDAVGRLISLKYGRNTKVQEVLARYKGEERKLVQYEYNDVNDLVAITDALGKTTRIRYQNHLMVEKTDRNNQTFYWEYEGHNTGAKCIHSWGDTGLLEGWIKYKGRVTEVTNSIGETTKYYYNDALLCVKVEDPLGDSVEYVYTDDMELYREVDEEANITGYTYDNRGNLKSKHLPDNSQLTFLYNEDDQLTLRMDGQGQTTVYTYNERKLLRSVSSPDGSIVTFKYNEDNQLHIIQNGEKVTLLNYDEDFNLNEIKVTEEIRTEWKYDNWGRALEVINPARRSQYLDYDELNRVVQIKNFDGNVLSLEYDGYEDVIKATDKHRKIEFSYNALGSLISREESATRLRFNYDTQNRLVSLKNENNEVYRFDRDEKGQVISETGFDGITRRYTRDRAGKVIKVQRPGKKWTDYEYDLLGRLTRAEHSDGSWETYSYNRNGQVIEACNENSTLKILRDKSGRVIKEICGEHWVSSEYDESGKRTKIASDLGAEINQSFNELGNIESVNARNGSGKNWDAAFEYNVLGLETRRILPGDVSSTFEYDNAGIPIGQSVSGKGKETLKRSYTWDVNSRLIRMVDDITHGQIQFGHDDFENLAWAKYENGLLDYRLPDAVGNLYKTPERNDRTYGQGGRLLKSDNATFEYDDEGNLVRKLQNNGSVWEYSWKGNGMLDKVTRPDGEEVSFEYDAFGRRLSKQFGKQITRWVWNGNVPLHEWKYKESEKPVAIVNEFGEFSFDRPEPVENIISWIFDEGSFKPAAKITGEKTYSVITDYLGTPVEMYDESGLNSWKAKYDIRGKIRNLENGNVTDCPFRYQGQYEDVETGLYYNRYRYYDCHDGRFISKDPISVIGGFNLYAYVGNPNNEVDHLGLVFTPNQQALIELANQASNFGRNPISGADADTLLKFAGEVNAEPGVTNPVKALDHRFSSGNNPAPGHFAHEGADGHIHIHNKHIPCK